MNDRNNTIGFIGMGMMGGGMAANLLKADFDMVAYDIDPAKNERFAGLGARIANGPAGVAQGASTVICIVETSAQIRDVVLGEGAGGRHLRVQRHGRPDHGEGTARYFGGEGYSDARRAGQWRSAARGIR